LIISIRKRDGMILAIDPGINNTGLSILSKESDIIRVIAHELIQPDKQLLKDNKTAVGLYGDRIIRLKNILDKIRSYLAQYPEIRSLAIEAPFYNRFRPNTYGSIVEINTLVKYNVCYQLCISYNAIEPLLIKKTFSNFGLSDKLGMKDSLIKHLEMKNIMLDSPVEQLSEHEIDSIAIGYTCYKLGRCLCSGP